MTQTEDKLRKRATRLSEALIQIEETLLQYEYSPKSGLEIIEEIVGKALEGNR